MKTCAKEFNIQVLLIQMTLMTRHYPVSAIMLPVFHIPYHTTSSSPSQTVSGPVPPPNLPSEPLITETSVVALTPPSSDGKIFS